MKDYKRKLKFKKIKIANMNILRGGGGTDTLVAESDSCPPTEYPYCPIPASDNGNACSDGCIRPISVDTAGTEVVLCGDSVKKPHNG